MGDIVPDNVEHMGDELCSIILLHKSLLKNKLILLFMKTELLKYFISLGMEFIVYDFEFRSLGRSEEINNHTVRNNSKPLYQNNFIYDSSFYPYKQLGILP